MKFWMPFFSPSLGTVAKRVKHSARVVTILDNVIPHEKRIGDDALIKYFLKQNHGFIAMSEKVKSDLHSYLPHAPCILHPHPLYDHFGSLADKSESRKALGIPEGKKVVLFFGFIREYKGLDILIKAIAKLDESYVLVIAGEVYGNFAPYEQLITEQGIGDRVVRHVRYISDHEVPAFFAAADVCVLPYKSATQSGITSIAFHFEKPVIATDVGGLKETITHGETGLIADRPDEELIAAEIKKYFRDNLESKLVQHIRIFKEKSSWAGLARHLVQFSETLDHRL